MATRIVIACNHDRTEPHPLPDATPVHILGSAGVTFAKSDMCEGGRVLDPGSYVLIEKVNGGWQLPIQPSEFVHDILDALAGGES